MYLGKTKLLLDIYIRIHRLDRPTSLIASHPSEGVIMDVTILHSIVQSGFYSMAFQCRRRHAKNGAISAMQKGHGMRNTL